MKTIALRFSDGFAPPDGTIAEHRKMIAENGFVWFGKLGARVSKAAVSSIFQNEIPQILLIHSGKTKRYWAVVQKVEYAIPPLNRIPSYYRNEADRFGTWFKISEINEASKDVLSRYIVSSSRRSLGEVSKWSMSPYFIIESEESGELYE